VRRLRDLLSTSFESNAHNAADNLSLSFSVAVSGVEVEGTVYDYYLWIIIDDRL
jgi:hypothetical protein